MLRSFTGKVLPSWQPARRHAFGRAACSTCARSGIQAPPSTVKLCATCTGGSTSTSPPKGQRCCAVPQSAVKSNLHRREFFADASSTLGYGCVVADDTSSIPTEARRAFGSYWMADQIPWHISMKELVAVRMRLNMYADKLRGHTVHLWEDNQAVVFIIRNRTSRSPLFMVELHLLL